MSYQVLARKWRPRRFAELVGQEHVVRALSNALDTGRMHHAYLFTGTRGVGKTTIARIFAKSLNCERGQSADPCGECAVCTAVDAGRFVDLLEIDAASNTGVDDVREVIENAQYAPTRGRFKVYLVDEVHMLSKNAFNALLKTLEEPPPHVKFLLATTDPQKLPVTVLSRCLKFNLKRLLPDQISGQMDHILKAEGIEHDPEAIIELARAADGSLRDGLSLLDQAIAYGGGALRAEDVRSMLGSVARSQVIGLLSALAAGDGAALMAECDQIASFSPDFGGVLDEIAGVLHRVQLLQLVPGYRGEAGDEQELAALAQSMPAEDVQLYYQLALAGRRELTLAPDARTGFEMCLLRMLAFRPADGEESAPVPSTPTPRAAPAPSAGRSASGGGAPAARASAPRQAAPAPSSASPAAPAESGQRVAEPATAPVPAPAPMKLADGELPDWGMLIERAGFGGPVRMLAMHATLVSFEGELMTLALEPQYINLAVEPMTGQMEESLANALGRKVRLHFRKMSEPSADSPAARAERQRAERQAEAEQSIKDDPLVQTLERDFDARVVPQSVRPVEH
ncbi:DNA polymerase III subunit gamma/tau [Oleiagrimonas sp. C23AA]|uniref:DNA polymerase III subunit gamma/tau n=1 Tax=Oleiagrimonas sp. C23AA TaxID=2719047 RepID=UPI0014209F76|nr:DNA polymerase III subunit gamma/tau [Oleiagrimonas sp. C23AA]NII10302.1 DNA polymerase III subunit gamma/tau [Oleiagrimonas sp. C23AA]